MADPTPSYGDYYREIYLRGLGGETPSIPVDWGEQVRAQVDAKLTDEVRDAAAIGSDEQAVEAAVRDGPAGHVAGAVGALHLAERGGRAAQLGRQRARVHRGLALPRRCG